jgi:hypothetical protein
MPTAIPYTDVDNLLNSTASAKVFLKTYAGGDTFPVVSTSDAGTTNAAAINAALVAVNTAGGGTVAITTPGTYLLTAITNPYASGRKCLIDLGDGSSNVTLYVGTGVTLKMADGQQVDAAPVDLVVFRNGTRIRVTGGGTITGNTAGQTGWTQSATGTENGTRYGQVTPGCIIRCYGTTNVYETYWNTEISIDNIRLTDHFGNCTNLFACKGLTLRDIYGENCGEGIETNNSGRVTADNVRYVDTGTRSAAIPSSTDTGTDVLAFGSATGWTTGSWVEVSATGGGLTAGGTYWYRVVTTTTGTLHTTQAGSVAGTGLVNLTGSITATLTATNRVTQGDGIEFADCVDVAVSNCLVDGYINGSAFDFYGVKRGTGANNHAYKCNSGFDAGTSTTYGNVADGIVFTDFVFKGLYGTLILNTPVGRCTFSAFQILDCTNGIGVFVKAGSAGDDGLCEFIGGTVNGCVDGLAVQLQTDAVNRKVKITGGSYSGNSQDGIRFGRASTGVPDMVVSGVTGTGNGRNGLTLDSQGSPYAPLGLITGCDFTGNTTAGIYDINGTTTTGITVQGCIPATAVVGVYATLLGADVLQLAGNTYGQLGNGSKNQRLIVRSTAGGVLVDASAGGSNNVRLVGAANFTYSSSRSSVTLFDGGDGFWYETARASF